MKFFNYRLNLLSWYGSCAWSTIYSELFCMLTLADSQQHFRPTPRPNKTHSIWILIKFKHARPWFLDLRNFRLFSSQPLKTQEMSVKIIELCRRTEKFRIGSRAHTWTIRVVCKMTRSYRITRVNMRRITCVPSRLLPDSGWLKSILVNNEVYRSNCNCNSSWNLGNDPGVKHSYLFYQFLSYKAITIWTLRCVV
jgi:hypothetical protein